MTLRRITTTSGGLTTSVTPYTSGDIVGNEFVFANAVPSLNISDGSGRVVAVNIIDEGNVLAACDLVLFSATSTPAVDNAANSWADADIRNYLGVVKFATADVNTSANNRYGTVNVAGLGIPFSSTGSIFGSLITRSANSFFVAVTDIRITLLVDS